MLSRPSARPIVAAYRRAPIAVAVTTLAVRAAQADALDDYVRLPSILGLVNAAERTISVRHQALRAAERCVAARHQSAFRDAHARRSAAARHVAIRRLRAGLAEFEVLVLPCALLPRKVAGVASYAPERLQDVAAEVIVARQRPERVFDVGGVDD